MKRLLLAGFCLALSLAVPRLAEAQAQTVGGVAVSGSSCPSINTVNVGYGAPLIETQYGALCVSGSFTASSASVGTIGSTAPTSADQIGFLSGANLTNVSSANPLPVTVTGGSTSNPAASATGSAVPASAGYTGLNFGGNLIGWKGDTNGYGDVNVENSVAVTGTFFQATQPVSGTVTAIQPTGSNLHVQVDTAPSTAVTNAGTFADQSTLQTQTDTVMVGGVNVKEWGATAVVTGGVNGAVGVGGPTAVGSAVAANPLPDGGEALSAEPAASTTTHPVIAFRDLVGKEVTSPYANRENMARGFATETGTSAGTILAASGSASLKEYVTDLECYNTSATIDTVTINDGASTKFVNPVGGGNNNHFNIPLVVAANTAVTFTATTGETTEGCAAQGFYGY